MANPPITIGPFTNVPAPGSAIQSAWAQDLTSFVWNQVRSGNVAVTTDAFGDGFIDLNPVFPGDTIAAIVLDSTNGGPAVIIKMLADNHTPSRIYFKAFDAAGIPAANYPMAASFIAIGF